MSDAGPIVSAPLVWVELITGDLNRASTFYNALLGWRPFEQPGGTDVIVYLDQARMAGPICGIRPRTPSDPWPLGVEGAPPDRWTVRLSPPRPPRAADPSGDQLLRPRAPGPRLGRWGNPNSLCYAELRTHDVEGASAWMERRLDAVLDATGSAQPGTVLLESSVNPSQHVAALVDEPDPSDIGWYPCVQVPALGPVIEQAQQSGALGVRERDVPTGCPGTAAAEVVDPGGARIVLVQHGPVHGRR